MSTVDFDQLVDGYEYQIWRSVKFLGIYRVSWASAMKAVFIHVDDQTQLDIMYHEWEKNDYTFFKSLATVRTMRVAKQYGVNCGRCKTWCPDAEVVPGFWCWACRHGR